MKLNCLGWSVFGSILWTIACVAVAVADPVTQLDSTVGQPHNGLSSQAFRYNAITANKDNLQALLATSLEKALSGQWLSSLLVGSNEKAMMTELVKCALGPGDRVKAVTRRDTLQFRGELNLCPDWKTIPLGQLETCQEIITACVMARVNASGKSIPISLRGASPPLALPHDRVPTDTRLRESPPEQDPSEGYPIGSFSTTCSGSECGWSAANVGTCTPGKEVQLAIEDPSDPSACKSLKMRVCTGLHGCMVRGIPTHSPSPPQEKEGVCASSPLSFICPGTGHEATQGYYSVMVRPIHIRPIQISQSSPKPPPTIVKIKGEGRYPAPEKDVFSYSEGAFYGNLFKGNTFRHQCDLSKCFDDFKKNICVRKDRTCPSIFPALPYDNVHACYTPNKADNIAILILNDRLCDLPHGKDKRKEKENTDCFAQTPKRCLDAATVANQGSQCEMDMNGAYYISCKPTGHEDKPFTHVISTYLSGTCDMIHDPKLAQMCGSLSNRPHQSRGAAAEAHAAAGSR